MAGPQYALRKSDDGTYEVEANGGDVETIAITRGFLTEQEARDWIAIQPRKSGYDPRWPELRGE